MPGTMVSQAKQQLQAMIEPYLNVSEVEQVLTACDYAEHAHDGVTRKSGEPYVLHPIAVSCILAHMTSQKAPNCRRSAVLFQMHLVG